VDATFGFFQNLNIYTYWARTVTEGRSGEDRSFRTELDYNGDRYGVQLEHLDIGANFNPEIGFARRVDLVKDRAFFRFSPRPGPSSRVRKYIYQAFIDVLQTRAGVTESRGGQADFQIDFQNAAKLITFVARDYEFLSAPFRIAPNVVLPVGSYSYTTYHAGYMLPSQGWGWLAGGAFVEAGTFYSGRKYSLTAVRPRLSFSSQLSVEPIYSLNHVSLVEGKFTTHLGGGRVTYTATPQMFTSALVQYNSTIGAVSANVRFRWEYQPGSELFVVFNEERDTMVTRFPMLANRSVIVKINRLFRF
jgi:hypothetical protein